VQDRNAFAEFLRARREHLTPADVGLPDSGRRRTPGLRREEVAALAGVSIDYLIRLEQGRDTNPSGSVMAAIADALQLEGDDRLHFFTLGHISSAPELCPEHRAPVQVVPDTVRQLLDRLGATPAFVLSPLYDVLAWNSTWERVAGPLGMLGDEQPNLIRFTFLHAGARTVYPDWADTADEQAFALRSVGAFLRGEPRFDALLAELVTAPDFASRWSAHAVSEKRRRTKRIEHPLVGELRIAHEVLGLPDGDGQRLVVWLPADDATDDALRRAGLDKAGLRAV
jgi:transcriptional regulator with XRE-family HTH domain